MSLYASLRGWHRWLGLSCLLLLFISSLTGIGLLLKKEFAILQPVTQRGTGTNLARFISVERAIAIALTSGHPDFSSLGDVDRLDVRPDKGVFKVRSRKRSEIQVDATTGAVLSSGPRVSDWLEDIHDGTIVGAWFRLFAMPIYALAIVALCTTGLVIWYLPRKIRRDRGVSR